MALRHIPDDPRQPLTESELAASIAAGDGETHGTWLATGPYDGEAEPAAGHAMPAPDADGDYFESNRA